MELKDMILSTLAELESPSEVKVETWNEEKKEELFHEKPQENLEVKASSCSNTLEDDKHFCESMRERILVLFEGFQSPNNKNIEAKVDLTLNFLEYLLAVIDERLESLEKK